MKDRNSQLNIIKNLIKEEIKLLKKNKFSLNEDIAATLDATAATDVAPIKDIKPRVIKSQNAINVDILDVKGYSLILKGLDDYIETKYVPTSDNNRLQVIYIPTAKDRNIMKRNSVYGTSDDVNVNMKPLLDKTNMIVTTDKVNKTITVELKFDETFNKIQRLGGLHGGTFETDEILELQLPKTMKYQIIKK